MLIFIGNMLTSIRNGATAPTDPWDAATLEWATASPPAAHNFDKTPVVYSRRPLWDTKYPELEMAHAPGTHALTRGEAIQRERERTHEVADDGPIHMPSPTFAPIILAFGVTLGAFGALYRFISEDVPVPFLGIIGLAVIAYAIVKWVRDSHADAPH